MKVKVDQDELSPHSVMLATQEVAQRCKELGITALHINLKATKIKILFTKMQGYEI